MIQYDFRLTLFNETKQEVEYFKGVNSLRELCVELKKVERTTGYHIVKFHARRLTPQADQLKGEK